MSLAYPQSEGLLLARASPALFGTAEDEDEDEDAGAVAVAVAGDDVCCGMHWRL